MVLLLSVRASAEEIAIFSRDEIVVGSVQASGPIPEDGTQRAFLAR